MLYTTCLEGRRGNKNKNDSLHKGIYINSELPKRVINRVNIFTLNIKLKHFPIIDIQSIKNTRSAQYYYLGNATQNNYEMIFQIFWKLPKKAKKKPKPKPVLGYESIKI